MKVVFDIRFSSAPVFLNGSSASDAAPDKKSDYIKKKVVPAAAMLGGGILLYLGLRGPNKNKLFDSAISQKLERMNGYVEDFMTAVDEKLSHAFKGADNYIEVYKKNYSYDFSKQIKKIKNAKKSEDVEAFAKFAFEEISDIYAKENKRQGATIFDKFFVAIDKEVNFLRGEFWKKRLDVRADCEDLVQFVFKDFNKPEKIAQGREKLAQKKNLADREMEEFQENGISAAINEKAKTLANTIEKSRAKFLDSRREILQAAFVKLKSFNAPVENFTNILGKNFEYLNIMSQACDKDLPKLYANLSLENNITDLKFLTKVLKPNKSLNKDEIANIAKRLQQLEKMAENELFELCRKDFDELSQGQVKLNLHRISKISQKLGYSSIKQMEKHYSETIFEFPARPYFSLIEEKPEIYFS